MDARNSRPSWDVPKSVFDHRLFQAARSSKRPKNNAASPKDGHAINGIHALGQSLTSHRLQTSVDAEGPIRSGIDTILASATTITVAGRHHAARKRTVAATKMPTATNMAAAANCQS